MMEAPPNRGAALNVQDGPINGHEVAQNGPDGPPSEPTNGVDRGPPNHGVARNERDGPPNDREGGALVPTPPTITRPSTAPPGIQSEMVHVCLKFIKHK
jgi:hypothetical protein